MNLYEQLENLENGIRNAKQILSDNLNQKGVEVSVDDSLTYLADNVANIPQGEGSGNGFDFSVIGYSKTLENEINSVTNNDIAYSKTKYDEWNPSNTSATSLYQGDTELVYAPNIDMSNVKEMNQVFNGCTKLKVVPKYETSKVTSMINLFKSCSNLTEVPLFDTSNCTNFRAFFQNCINLKIVPTFNTSKATEIGNMFDGCSNLTEVPLFDTSNCTNMGSMFYGCKSLTSIPKLDSRKSSSLSSFFYGCSSLKRIEELSLMSLSQTVSYSYFVGYSNNYSLRYILFKDIGYQERMKTFNNSYVNNWGVNSDEVPDARQSLIDSLITYSFDRAEAGYETCTITLSSNSKALLSEEEIAAITAKGYTIA